MAIIQQIKKALPNIALVTYIRQIESNLESCQTILDVGCGDSSPLRLLSGSYEKTGVDGYKKALEISKKGKIHDQYIQLDVTKLSDNVKGESYDAVISLDVIEHLPKKDGYQFLKSLEKAARRVVILNTPNGFIEQHNKSNQLQEHLSGWSVEDFRSQGYQVLGMYGLKSLRGEGGNLKFGPTLIWGIVSLLTHYIFTKNNPKYAFSLMAIKRLK